MNKKTKKLTQKRKEWWETERFKTYNQYLCSPHPRGYCGNQSCCWGKPGDKVIWA